MPDMEFDKRSGLALKISDSLIMIQRSSRHILRNLDQLLGTFFQPIMFIILFAAVFGGAIGLALPEGVEYIDFLMAGIVVQTLAFGSTTTAIAINNDMSKGIIDRFRSLPMGNLAVLNGHVVSDVFRNGISTIVLILVGLLIGFRPNASLTDWLLIAFITFLFTLAFSWISAIMGVLAKSVEAVQWISFIIIFPLTFASSAYVPTEGMGKYLKMFAENQPITQVIEALRALFLDYPVGDYVWTSIAWCVAIMVVSVPIAAYLFKKRNSQ